MESTDTATDRPSPGNPRAVAIGRRRTRLIRKYVRPLLSYGTPRRLLNMMQGELHLRRRDIRLRSMPYVVALDPSNICNLRCPLCPTGQLLPSRSYGRMDLGFYKNVIDQIAPTSYKVVLHNWGEPLLHPRLAEMVAYASDRRLATEFSANMNLLPDGMAEDLVRARLTRLVISIDGATQETYAAYRKGGNLEKVFENIAKIVDAKRRLKSSFPFMEVQVLVMRQNEHELDVILERCREAGVDHCEFGFTLVNTQNEEQIKEWLPKKSEYLRYEDSDWEDRFLMSDRPCSWLWRSLVVNWDGTAFPCCNFERKEAEIGDLKKMSLRELWNSPLYTEARQVFRNGGGEVPKGPLKPAQHICEWCRGVPRSQTKDQAGVY